MTRKEKLKRWLVKAFRFLTNPRFLLCFGLAWIVTNGWSYALLAIGTYFGIHWMTAIADAYMALLWFPFTPEKVFTFAIAMGLLRWLFPKDEKTLKVMHELHLSAKQKFHALHEKRRAQKQNRKSAGDGSISHSDPLP